MTTRKQFQYQDKTQYYTVAGEGTPVILLHGFGEDGRVWDTCVHLLEHCKFIIPDLPGTGTSEMIENASMEGLAACVQALAELENTSGEPVILLGHSMGGYIALAFAERYPVAGLGLVHSTAFADGEDKRATRKKGIGFIRENGAYAFLKATIPALYSSITKEQAPEKLEDHIQKAEGFSDEALIAYYTAMLNRPDRTEVLKRAEMPVLFLLGKEDSAVPLAEGLQQCHLPKLSYIHIHQSSGHMGMIEEPEASAQVFRTFFSLVNGHRP